MTDPGICPGFPAEIELPPLGNLPGHRHVFDARSTWAMRGALGARRALLVRGEPGTGKSELARAAAAHLKRPLISVVVTSGLESQDLLWRFDAVARLALAQVLRVVDDRAPLAQLDEVNFLQPGPLWWVLDWPGAEAQWQRCKLKPPRPETCPGWTPKDGCVLLIDEIDKAEPDLPNGLLESLGNGRFQVPYLGDPVSADLDAAPPLVIITTNEERELPP
ncbi:MAG: AAA domain-containing protein, partial [bacterium]|nr:AAA domain-containing protein [bacterium]